MIPNTLLLKWIDEEFHTVRYFERRFVEGGESRKRHRIASAAAADHELATVLLDGYRRWDEQCRNHEEEVAIARRRLDQRHHIESLRETLRALEAKVVDAHKRLSAAQRKRNELADAFTAHREAEADSWRKERRWMLRQLDGMKQPQAQQRPATTPQTIAVNQTDQSQTLLHSKGNGGAAAWREAMQHHRIQPGATEWTRMTEEIRQDTQQQQEQHQQAHVEITARTNAALARARQVLAAL